MSTSTIQDPHPNDGNPTPQDLEAALRDYEQTNPKVATAMKLFGMSMAEYQGALYAMQSPRLYQSSSTATRGHLQK